MVLSSNIIFYGLAGAEKTQRTENPLQPLQIEKPAMERKRAKMVEKGQTTTDPEVPQWLFVYESPGFRPGRVLEDRAAPAEVKNLVLGRKKGVFREKAHFWLTSPAVSQPRLGQSTYFFQNKPQWTPSVLGSRWTPSRPRLGTCRPVV